MDDITPDYFYFNLGGAGRGQWDYVAAVQAPFGRLHLEK